LSEAIPQPGPGTRLPIISGWSAHPGYRHLWYRDAASNTEQLKIYDTIQRPNGYFFLLPDGFEKQLDDAQQSIAILCRTNYDTTNLNRPCVDIAGVRRIQIRVFTDTSPLEGEWIAEVKDILPPDTEQQVAQTRDVFRRWVDSQVMDANTRSRLEAENNPVDFSHDLCESLSRLLPKTITAQSMQTADVGVRLTLVREWMETQIAQDPAKSLTLRFDQLAIPPDVRSKLDVELSLLQLSTTSSADRERLLTYLQFAASLPWGDHAKPPNTNLAQARTVLASEHAGVENAKKMVLDQLATLLWWKQLANQTQQGAPSAQPPLRNLLLVGPPGTGKTTFLKSLAAALDRPVEIIPCGGISDMVALNGLERGYIGARVGAILEAVMRAKTVGLVLGFDEIDKMGRTYRGDPYGVLIELTDQVRNTQFTDRYLQFPFDLSEVLIVATANTLDPIPSSLRDRFDIIELRGYSLQEKLHMARSYLLPRLYNTLALSTKQVSITKAALTCVIEDYTDESGVRGLDRTLLTLLQRVLADLLADPSRKRLGPAQVHDYLGTPSVLHNQTPLSGSAGYIPILAIAVETGIGTINGMQVSLLKAGTGKCFFSGFGDDVVKESVQIAISYIKLHADELAIDASIFSTHDLHIHCDEIAHRKRGPSAGVAIFLAIVSALRARALPEKWAVTGEMALDGRILVVGGVAEKLVAAHRAGITTVLIPGGNRANLADLPEDVLAQLTIIAVTNIKEALAYAFPREIAGKQELPVKTRDGSDDAERSKDEEGKPATARRYGPSRAGRKRAS
jgi:ATP-dependent Lon protease